MKAITYFQYGSPDVLQLREVEKPVPKDNEILIRIHATVVEPADCAFREGKPFATRLAQGLLKPKNNILGAELAGEVEAVGKDVQRFKPGDRVFGASGPAFGAHAEYICLPADGALTTMPADMSYEQAVALCDGPLTALPFLRDEGKIQKGQKVLINGASGAVGGYAVQLAKYFGAEVTGVCSTRNVEQVKALGADAVIDYTTTDFTRNGQTFDIIFDAVGKSSFARCKGALKPGGIYLSTVLNGRILWQTLWTSKIGNKKAVISFTGLRSDGEKAKDLEFIKKLFREGHLRPVIDKRFSLEQVPEAHRYVDTGRKRGNVVILA